jgi:hypothetical protein
VTHTPHNPRRSTGAQFLDALTHSGPGYYLTPVPAEQSATFPTTPEREQEWQQQLADQIRTSYRDLRFVADQLAADLVPILRAAVAASTKELASLAVNAANALRDERCQYEIACKRPRRAGDHPTADATEEVGEVSQAWIGVTGQNPRKGVTHTIAAVRDELCDVILTAAVALGSVSDNPAAVLDSATASPPAASTPPKDKDAAHCAECGHSRDDHREGDDPVTPGQCTTCAAADPDSSWHDYEPGGDA